MDYINNDIIRVLEGTPMALNSIQSQTGHGVLRPGYYLVAPLDRLRTASLFGPFPNQVAAKLVSTSARSFGCSDRMIGIISFSADWQRDLFILDNALARRGKQNGVIGGVNALRDNGIHRDAEHLLQLQS